MYNLLNFLTDDFFEPAFPSERTSATMAVDVKETDKAYILDVELPGFDKKDINLDYENGYLTVSAEVHTDKENKSSYIRRERFVGRYERSFYVGEIEKNSIKASYKDGILEVNIPKEDEKKLIERRSIAIN